MTPRRLAGAATLFAVILLGASPAARAQAYVPGVTCPAGQAMTGDSPQTGIVCASLGTVFHNRLVNPTMEIDQANEGNSVSLVSGTPAYVVDGVKIGFVSTGHATNATLSCQRTADAPTGYTYSLKCTVGTAASAVGSGDYIVALLPIEADNIQDALLGTAGAQTLCVQFQAKVSIASYVAGWALQNFAQTRSYPNALSALSASTWTPESACFTGDIAGTWVTSGNAGGAYLVLTFAAGSTFQGTGATWASADTFGTSALTNSLLTTAGATFEITNVKLEVAPAASPFRRRPFQQELALCQRYYEKSYDPGVLPGTVLARTGQEFFGFWGTTNATYSFGIRFKVPKRAQATVTVYSPTTGASGNVDNNTSADITAAPAQIGLEGFQVGTTTSFTPAAIGGGLRVHWTADARL